MDAGWIGQPVRLNPWPFRGASSQGQPGLEADFQGGPSVSGHSPTSPTRLDWKGPPLSISRFPKAVLADTNADSGKDFNTPKNWPPVVIDLRGNAGGQSARMEMLWRHVATSRRQLPFGLVAKQSPETRQDILRHYKRLRKRWVDKHKDSLKMPSTSTTSPTCQWGNSTRLSLGPNLCGLALPRSRLLGDGRRIGFGDGVVCRGVST